MTGVTVVDVRRFSDIGPVSLVASARARELRERRMHVVQQHIEAATERFVSECRAAGVLYDIRQEEGNPFDLLASCARYHDLMVFGLKSLLEHDVVPDPHDVLVRLVAERVRPLLAVSADTRPIHRVLIAYSGSMESAKTMKWFVQLGLWPKAQLRIVTFQHQVDEAEQLIGDAADYLRKHGFKPEEAYVPGSPKHQLLSYAAEWEPI